MVVNQTVELVKLWGAYEAQHPGASIEDFCRYQLAQNVKSESYGKPKGELRPDLNGQLVILLRRIGKFHIAYSNKALEGTGLDQMEEFGILVTIYNQKNPIKSEAIYNNIMELSSGSNMLIRLKKRGLVSEYDDEQDKRVKRLKLTAKGEATLLTAKEVVLKVARMMVNDLSDEQKRLCIQLLSPIDRRFSGLFQKQRAKSFDDIYLENVG
ncbi:MarR family winged helix-turn-helix transcriptional regulator [Mucilaginibacter ginsenosidivorax]|uniref:Winged helix DNA-binding protein n=1 Tax=Mucilaginibacter ginsenosidivorax TaxID=862126 RepID=A0A5B8W5H0_9SPHI|nr:winged helix DNA-binding protein [Mucilaginibacter ginsenosidivorax]QEC78687.1 winged helix DNA-binding protein [Mucilaginibacter ginsenosidivorax]